MGWNKRSSGRVYDSLSGRAFLIGCRSGNVIYFGVCAKKCVKCARATKLGVDPKSHVCSINHVGSSGSMEAKLALQLTEELYTDKSGHIFRNKIMSDSDSTMRSLLKHKCNHDKRLLPENIPQSVFLADPSYCIKVISKRFFLNGDNN